MDSKFPTKNAREFADDLFQTCNLTEIESLQNTLKKDVEKKADQLKSLVRCVTFLKLKVLFTFFSLIMWIILI